jgi:hypothetical protein
MSKETLESYKRQLEVQLNLTKTKLQKERDLMKPSLNKIREYETLATNIERRQPTDPALKIPTIEDQIRYYKAQIAEEKRQLEVYHSRIIKAHTDLIAYLTDQINELTLSIEKYNNTRKKMYNEMPVYNTVSVVSEDSAASVVKSTSNMNNTGFLTRVLGKLKFGGRSRCKTVRRVRRSKKTARKHSRR